ncbi:MAG: hypothetical protein LPK09_14770 [Hymenobacteraceae bacterium]|nr:hypothetical protein [Hymenobacteraceae bacterium]
MVEKVYSFTLSLPEIGAGAVLPSFKCNDRPGEGHLILEIPTSPQRFLFDLCLVKVGLTPTDAGV